MCTGLIRSTGELFCKSFVNDNVASHLVLFVISLTIYYRRVGGWDMSRKMGWQDGGMEAADKLHILGKQDLEPCGIKTFEGFVVIMFNLWLES